MNYNVMYFKKKYIDGTNTYIKVGETIINYITNTNSNIYRTAFLNAPNQESKLADKVIVQKK